MPASFTAPTRKAYPDWLGVAASLLCAIHCAAMPFIVGSLPLLGLSFLADPSFHKWMVGVCLGMALLAFIPGWRRHHRLSPAIVGLLGLSLISIAAFAGPEDCCPTPCDRSTTYAQTTTSSQNDLQLTTIAATDQPACSASCCPDDANTVVPMNAGVDTDFFWVLMTPLGGVILVIAHLTNHRLGCRCQCATCQD